MADMTEVKKALGREAVDRFVVDGMKLGLGTGSTAIWAVRRVAERIREGSLKGIRAVTTSLQSELEARRLGIPVGTLNDADLAGGLDLTIDGADEVDGAHNAIKGGGGALLMEKIVAYCSRRFLIIVDEEKLSSPAVRQVRHPRGGGCPGRDRGEPGPGGHGGTGEPAAGSAQGRARWSPTWAISCSMSALPGPSTRGRWRTRSRRFRGFSRMGFSRRRGPSCWSATRAGAWSTGSCRGGRAAYSRGTFLPGARVAHGAFLVPAHVVLHELDIVGLDEDLAVLVHEVDHGSPLFLILVSAILSRCLPVRKAVPRPGENSLDSV